MDDIDWGSAVDEELANAAGFLQQTWSDPTALPPWADGFNSAAVDHIDPLAGGDGPNVPHPIWESRIHEHKSIQTDVWTTEREMNTNPDWQRVEVAYHSRTLPELRRVYEEIEKESDNAESSHKRDVDSLKRKIKESKRQHQALLDKIESVQVKLQLNCSKTTRKNFAVKKRELVAEKSKMEDERSRLTQELEDIKEKLSLLTEEQSEEKKTWAQELSELKAEMEKLQREAEEASLAAQRDEIAALEVHRDAILSQVNNWLKEAKQYCDTIRMDPSKQHERLRWEQVQAEVHNSLGELQNQFKDHLQLLHKGHKLMDLPTVNMPDLPHIPMVDLVISQMFLSPRPPMQHMGMPLPPQHLPSFSAPARVTPPLAPSPSPSHSPLPMAPPGGASLRTPPPSSQPSAQPPTPSNPPPAGKLEILLEKLGARFPHCTRAQLMSVLQHIKMSRGTMAGMSVEEVTQQVALRLEPTEPAAVQPQGPTRPPAAARGKPGPPTPIQRPPGPIQRPAVAPQQRPAQVFNTRPPQPAPHSSRKLCLMCQNQVEAANQHSMSCSHTVHKECISVWLQSSKNNTCPFCPAK